MLASTLIASESSPYGSYEVVDTVYNGRLARVLYGAERLSAQSGMALDDNPLLLFDYNQRFMELIEAKPSSRLAILGGGAFTLPKAILDAYPDASLDIVELDPLLYAIAQKHFNFVAGLQTTVYIQDAIYFLKQSAAQRYGLLLIDLFTQTTIPPNFQTASFARLVKHSLQSDGLVAMNIIASYHGQRSAILRRIVASFQLVFSDVALYPAGHEPSLWLPQNFILIGRSSPEVQIPDMRYPAVPLPTSGVSQPD